MCGICGVLWTEASKAVNIQTLDKMTDVLGHRGPDDRGTYWRNGMALGHRRLSILDLSPQGHQPMSNENDTVWIVFNGEIYNFEPLRQELLARGHRFKSQSDTEVLLHLYEEYGETMLHRLNGMFAFAVWDASRRKLFLARDRIGKKPLFYCHEPGRLLFASEMKSILQVPNVPREVDPEAVDEYLTYQYIPHPKTIFRGISKLPPGHFAVWENNYFIVKRYWNMDFNSEEHRLKPEEWSEELRSLVTDAVKIRLRSDVPVGAFLSGGIDSSITAGIMQQESTRQIRTFSIGFPQKEYDETAYAESAANRFGTRHQKFIVTPDIHDILPKLIWHYDEPFADSSAIPMWYLSRETRREAVVALSGDGGDELFAGYDRYRAIQLANRADLLPCFVRRFLAGPVRAAIPVSTRQRSSLRRFKRFLEALAMKPMERYLQWIAVFNNTRRLEELYTPDFRGQLNGHDPLHFLLEAESCCVQRDAVSRISFVDMQTYLPCDIMTKVDIASMAHSLECRAPLLDYRIAEWAAKLPIHCKIHGHRGKFILRKTFQHLLPKDIERRGKMGFGVPIDHWFRGPLRETVQEVLLDSRTFNRGLFQKKGIETLLRDHFAGRFDHAYRIWALFILELWFRRWVDQ
ncbi:MAG: asparagine synthase (glutamine-hydrolyzing) [Planctomycetaceae bacterium]|jgi:asparagine synthase (glutamine-hydrolysing)|nr:asparagine synthase (glutamine-hydrolyzing) [Planctomycetaceae bacterium]